jgi:hypothetical protein
MALLVMFKTAINKKILTSHAFNAATTTILLLGTLILLPEIGLTETIRAMSAQKETLYLNNDRTYAYNLTAANNITINGVPVPRGATIVGRYEPAKGGLRYVARAIVYKNRTLRINATSSVLKDVKDPRDTSAAAIAEDAGIGAAGGLVVGEVLGHASAGEIIGGAAAGGVVGNVTADRVVVIKSNVPISLYTN